MNNEPVAWVIDAKMADYDDNFIWNTGNYPDWRVKSWIPLYTRPVKQITDEEIHQAIRRGFARDGFLSDGIFLEIKELLRNTQGVNSEQVPDFFFMENDLMGKR